jgi:hypothetical protein
VLTRVSWTTRIGGTTLRVPNHMTWARSGARAWSLSIALSSGALACAGDSSPPPEYPPMPASSVAPAGTVQGAEGGAPPPLAKGKPGTELAGEWVEFWALQGAADTQRYVFGADGQFEWSAAVESQDAVLATFGSYVYDGTSIALTIKMERPRDLKCDAGCRKPVDPPRTVQLPVTDCPPNEEARALDGNYRCLAFGDRAFWLKSDRR